MATKKKALQAAAGAAGGDATPAINGYIVTDNWVSGTYDGMVRAYDFNGENPGAELTVGTGAASNQMLGYFQFKETGVGIWTRKNEKNKPRIFNADSNGDIVFSEPLSSWTANVGSISMSDDGLNGFIWKDNNTIYPMSRDSLDDTWTLGSSKSPPASLYYSSTNRHFFCHVEGADNNWVVLLDITNDIYSPEIAVYDYSSNTVLSTTLAGDFSLKFSQFACANSGYVNGNYFYTFYVAARNDPAAGVYDSYIYRARVDLTTGTVTRTKINSSIFDDDEAGKAIQSVSFYPHNGVLSVIANNGTYQVGVMQIDMDTNGYSVLLTWSGFTNQTEWGSGPYDLDNDVFYQVRLNASNIPNYTKTSTTTYTSNTTIQFTPSPSFTIYGLAPIYSEAFEGTAPWES